MNKIRLDVCLVNKNIVPSRSKASELIHNGKIMVNGKVIIKPSFEVLETDEITLLENELLKFVSRGGLKLEKALTYFNINIKDFTILDIGASTGGFTDCALKHNAKKVYSLDVGTDQLHESLRNDSRVISLENTNFKDVNHEMIKDNIDLYVCDVSFISITTILKILKNFDDKFTIIILYKPQFEVGKNNLNANGVVKNKKVLLQSLNNFKMFLDSLNIGLIDGTYSPITGQKEGNVEFLFYLKSNEKSNPINFEKIIDEAYNVLKVKKC